MEVTIDLTGVNELAARMAGAGEIVEAELGAGMQRITKQGQAYAMEATPVWQGHLRRAWTAEASATGGKIGNNTPYARVVNDGRRAGAPMPPTGALLGWMRSKGIPAEAEFVVRRAIGRRGTPPRRMKEQTIERLRPGAEAEGRAIVARIVARLRG